MEQVLGVCKLKVRNAIPGIPDAKPVQIDLGMTGCTDMPTRLCMELKLERTERSSSLSTPPLSPNVKE